jgi:hypothetical protein
VDAGACHPPPVLVREPCAGIVEYEADKNRSHMTYEYHRFEREHFRRLIAPAPNMYRHT